MAEEQKKEEKKTEKKLEISKPSVDFPVRVIATEADPYHETDKEFDAGAKKALELEKRGWVKLTAEAKKRIEELRSLKLLSVVLLLSLFSFAAQAQVPADFRSIYNLTSDTVTNTATQYLQSPLLSPAPATSTTIWIAVTKISGTVGGTITLQGSFDGTTYKAINTVDTQTALATITATDASNTYHYRLQGSPFLYYRVSWTGTGTMAASFTAKVVRAK